MNLSELKEKTIPDLNAIARDLNVQNIGGLRKQELIFKILQAQAEKDGLIFAEGVLEVLPDGYGFLRAPDYNYLPGPDDIYVSPSQIRRFDLRTGDTISGQVRPPKDTERYFALLKVEAINFETPDRSREKIFFDNLTPLYPDGAAAPRDTSRENLTTRVMDLPVADRQGPARPDRGAAAHRQDDAAAVDRPRDRHQPPRGLPHRAAHRRAARKRSPTCSARCRARSVVAPPSTSRPQRHIQVADMVIEKAKRLVEHKRDVVILLDSITRFARAHNAVIPSSGKVLSGGLDANALQRPRRFFATARNIEEGGSLTIMATALVDTGSRMDDVIFEEFKGTGNMEVHLDRRLMDKRIFPTINIEQSGTRKEELLLEKDELQKVWLLRKALSQLNPVEAMELLLDKLKLTRSNKEFLASMQPWGRRSRGGAAWPLACPSGRRASLTTRFGSSRARTFAAVLRFALVSLRVRGGASREGWAFIRSTSTRRSRAPAERSSDPLDQAGIRVEMCSKCHPFFTGKQKFMDTAGRVERFQRKYARPGRRRAAVATPEPRRAGAGLGSRSARGIPIPPAATPARGGADPRCSSTSSARSRSARRSSSDALADPVHLCAAGRATRACARSTSELQEIVGRFGEYRDVLRAASGRLATS